MSVVLGIVTMDVTTHINCQVGTILYLLLTWALTSYNFQFWFLFSVVSTIFLCPRLRGENADRFNADFHQILLFLASMAASLLIVFRTYVLIHSPMQNNFRESG